MTISQIKFIGCGDAFGSGGRFNACFRIKTGHSRFLIDCGASSMIGLNRAGENPNDIDAIIVSHFDADHFGGVAFFLVHAHLVCKRTRALTVAGPPGLRHRLWQWIDLSFPARITNRTLGFDLPLIELQPGETATFCGLSVMPFAVRHFGSDVGAPPMAFRIAFDGRTIAYSGDTGWVDALIPCAKEADLFIAEAWSYDTLSPFHLDFKTLIQHLPDIGARRVIATHMSEGVISRGKNGILEGITLAHDNMVVEL